MNLFSRASAAIILTTSLGPSGPLLPSMRPTGPLPAQRGSPLTRDLPRCEGLREEILGRAIDPVGSVDTAEQERLVSLVRQAEAAPGATGQETCAITILREMAAAPSCGSAAELIASTLALDAVLTADAMRDALVRSGPCSTAVVSGAASEQRFERGLFKVIEDWTLKQTNPVRRSGGFVR
jgi:hypothetical protein